MSIVIDSPITQVKKALCVVNCVLANAETLKAAVPTSTSRPFAIVYGAMRDAVQIYPEFGICSWLSPRLNDPDYKIVFALFRSWYGFSGNVNFPVDGYLYAYGRSKNKYTNARRLDLIEHIRDSLELTMVKLHGWTAEQVREFRSEGKFYTAEEYDELCAIPY